MRGAETVAEGVSRLSERLFGAAEAYGVMTAAEEETEAAQTALLAPITAMLAQSQLLTADLISAALTFEAMAAAEGVAAAATGVLDAALALLLAPLTLIVAGLALLTSGLLLAGKGLEAFSTRESTLARTALQLKNLKGSIPIAELTEFSDHMEELTGINHNVIESLGAMASQFGLTKSQVEKAIPTVLDIAQAKGLNPQEVLQRLLQASAGRTRGLISLGIDPAKIHGDLHDINNLINQVGKGFTGVAAGFRNTLPGTTEALKSSLERLFEALGRFIQPVVLPLLNLMISGIDKLTAVLDRIAQVLHLPTSADLGGGTGSDIALKGDPEQTAALKGIEKNTKATADSFVKGVLGGAGIVARAGFNARDARIAFGI